MHAIRLFLAAAIAASAGLAQAGPIHEALSGRYEFHPTVNGPKGSLCREIWTFDEQAGTLRVESGTEVVLKRFRMEQDFGEIRLITKLIETNGGTNCSGMVRDPSDQSDKVTYLQNRPNGGIAICPEPLRSDDGTAPLYGGCYGEIIELPPQP